MSKLERHAEQFGALGHPARLAILCHVVQRGAQGATPTGLQEKLGIPWTTLNHHLARLVEAGLVRAERDGKSVYHSADYAALKAMTSFLWEDCCKAGQSSPDCC
jgi:DNA-binding transcriptional ArsR family regulator